MTLCSFKPLVVIATATAVAGCASSTIEVSPILAINGDRVDTNLSGNHQRGLAHMQAGRFGPALREFRQALREDPDNIETLNAIAVAYDLMERFESAHRYYERALALDPNSLQTLNNLGRSYLAQGNVHMASEYLERAGSIDPSAPQLQGNLKLLASLKDPAQRPPTQATAGTVFASLPANNAWIERTTALEQTLVTAPSRQGVEALAALNVDPRTVSFKADLGHDRSGPFYSDGAIKHGSKVPSPIDTTRLDASSSDASENAGMKELFQVRGDAIGDANTILRTAPSETIRSNATGDDGTVDHEQSSKTYEEYAAAPAPVHHVLVHRPPRPIAHGSALSELALDAPTTTAQPPDSHSLGTIDMAVASTRRSRAEAAPTDVEVSNDAGKTVVTAKDMRDGEADEELAARKPDGADRPTSYRSGRFQHELVGYYDSPARALNACSLNRIKSGLSVAGSNVRPDTNPSAAAEPKAGSTDGLHSNANTTTSAPFTLVEVSGAGGRSEIASQVGHRLSAQGLCVYMLSNAEASKQEVSKILYSPSFEDHARRVVEALPSKIPMEADETLTSNIRLILGQDVLNFDLYS